MFQQIVWDKRGAVPLDEGELTNVAGWAFS